MSSEKMLEFAGLTENLTEILGRNKAPRSLYKYERMYPKGIFLKDYDGNWHCLCGMHSFYLRKCRGK